MFRPDRLGNEWLGAPFSAYSERSPYTGIVMRVKTLLLATLAAFGVFTPLASARPPLAIEPGWIMPVQDDRERQQLRPLREAIDMLRAQYGGEYVSHRLEDGPRPVYVIRWRMPDGVTTRDFRVDATR